MSYLFTVMGNPIPKARPRVVNGHAYTPATTEAWEHQIAFAYYGPYFEGDLSITLHFYRKTKQRVDLMTLLIPHRPGRLSPARCPRPPWATGRRSQ